MAVPHPSHLMGLASPQMSTPTALRGPCSWGDEAGILTANSATSLVASFWLTLPTNYGGHVASFWQWKIQVGVWVWVCGSVCVCVCGCVGVWVCGCVGLWVGVYVCVGVCVCGCVGGWVGAHVGVYGLVHVAMCESKITLALSYTHTGFMDCMHASELCDIKFRLS